MTALEKQIQASEKRLAKFEKNISMYSGRMKKKIAKLQSSGYMVTESDFTIGKTGKWKYDYDIKVSDTVKQSVPFALYTPVMDDLERRQENQDRAENEKKLLEELLQRVKIIEQQTQDTWKQDEPLRIRLTQVLSPYKEQWMLMMKDYHKKYFTRIHKLLPEAREQYKVLGDEIDKVNRQNGYRHTALVKQLEDKRSAFGRILSSKPAAYMTLHEYMAYVTPLLEEEFKGCILTLTEKCRPFALDDEKIEIHHPRMSERGFEILVTDDKPRVVDARMIWAAECSECVKPHTRYIVTERKK